MSSSRTLLVPDGLDGERVDAALSRLLGLSRSKVADLASAGYVRVDGRAVGKGDRLVGGSFVDVELPAVEPPAGLEVVAEPVEGMRIVHDDSEIVVVDKPAYVAAHPSVGWSGPTVVGGLAGVGYRISTSGAPERQGIVQRLGDRTHPPDPRPLLRGDNFPGMGFLDRLFGRDPQQQPQQHPQQQWSTGGYEPPTVPGQGRMRPVGEAVASEDERAIARYRYLLRTAPPERLEEVHAEAFGQLSPQQRQQLLGQLSQDLPAGEAPRSDDPRDLARAATRAEMRQPGYLQGALGGGRGPGMGSMVAGSMMGTIAGVVVGSAIADSLFGGYEASPEAADVGESGAGFDGGDTGGDGGYDGGGDVGGDGGGFFGDSGGDVGGDFGGGDFGGDFGGFDF